MGALARRFTKDHEILARDMKAIYSRLQRRASDCHGGIFLVYVEEAYICLSILAWEH